MDLYAELKRVIDELKAEYALAKADGQVDMRELGQLCIHTAYAVSNIIARGAVEEKAVSIAAAKLYDELLAPVLLAQIDAAVSNMGGIRGWLVRIAKTIGAPLIQGLLRDKWMTFVAGLLEASLPMAQAESEVGKNAPGSVVRVPTRTELARRRDQRRQARQERMDRPAPGSAPV